MKSGSPFLHLAQLASRALLALVLGGMAAAFPDGPPAGTYPLEHGPLMVSVEYAHERHGRVPVLVFTDILAATLWMTPDGSVWDEHLVDRPWGRPLFRIDWANGRLAFPGGAVPAADGKKPEAQDIPFRRARKNNHRARLLLPDEFCRSTLEISADRRLGWWRPFGEGGPGLCLLVTPTDEAPAGSVGRNGGQAGFRLFSRSVSGRFPFFASPRNALRPLNAAQAANRPWTPAERSRPRSPLAIPGQPAEQPQG